MRLSAHFGQWLEVGHRGRKARRWQVAAGLIYGQVKKSYRRRKLVRVSHVMRLGTDAALRVARPRTRPLWTLEHRFYGTSKPDCPSWGGRASTSHLGHGEARSTVPGPSRVVASLLSFRTSPRSATSGPCSATRARWQTSRATLPAVYPSNGSWENQSKVVSTRNALLSLATGATLHHLGVHGVRGCPVKW
jgi:hypothetical protein